MIFDLKKKPADLLVLHGKIIAAGRKSGLL